MLKFSDNATDTNELIEMPQHHDKHLEEMKESVQENRQGIKEYITMYS